MAPPRKRRRLSESSASLRDMTLFEPIPTLLHPVSETASYPILNDAHPVPTRIEEVHFHIQERSAQPTVDKGAELQKRYSAYPITTIDANGNTIVSTVTAGLNAGAATSILPAEMSPETTREATRTRERTDAASDRTTSSNERNTPSPGTSAGVMSAAAASTNSTQSDSTSTGTSVYLATLTNDNVVTITRSPGPYVTTFADNEVSTICPTGEQCRLQVDSTASSQSSASSGGGEDGSQSSAAAASGSTSNAQQNNDGDDDGGPSISSVAGGVVGGLAALALILVLILLLLRWYKRRQRQSHQALMRSSSLSPEPEPQYSTSHSGMAERAGVTPLVTAVPTFFRHQDKSLEETGSSERGFARVSGRKIPSAFDQGAMHRDMNSPPPDMPLNSGEKDLVGTSFYRDSSGFYGGDGTQSDPAVSPGPSQSSDQAPAAMTLSPGPQRTPTIHDPAPYVLTPSTSSPDTPLQQHVRSPSGPGLSPFVERSGTPTYGGRETPTIARSETPSTIPDNRSSRFTEDF